MLGSLQAKPSLGSDNHSGVHPKVIDALLAANVGHMPAYGTDSITQEAQQLFVRHFGAVDVFFVFNGTAANVLSLYSMMPSHAAVLCANTAHLHADECAAPEAIVGCKVMALPSKDGKLRPADILPRLIRQGDQHFAAPRVLSVTQPTEYGTLYSVAELQALAALCREHHLLFHMDGARLVNAAAAMQVDLRTITADVGLDVLSFGGTKNGLMFGEAVVFFNRPLAANFAAVRKQNMQLGSKLRFVAAQFCALLDGDLWRTNALHANAMAQHLARQVQAIKSITITQPVQANVVFARVPKPWVKPLRDHSFFYVWDEMTWELRWMTTFDTDPRHLDSFCALLQQLAAET